MPVHKGDLEIDGILIARDIEIKRGKHGDLLYKHRGKWVKLHIGAQGEVLTVDADGFPSWATPSMLYGSALPPAGVTYRCKFFTVLGGAGVRDRLYKCLKSGAGVYSWVEIANGGA